MDALGLDSTYGAYLDRIPGATLATVNVMSMFGLQRRWRGAIVGHLAMFEITSAEPNRRYANGLRRLGLDSGHSVLRRARRGGLRTREHRGLRPRGRSCRAASRADRRHRLRGGVPAGARGALGFGCGAALGARRKLAVRGTAAAGDHSGGCLVRLRPIDRPDRAGESSSVSSPIFLCVPSHRGWIRERPQRQIAIVRRRSSISSPSSPNMRTGPRTRMGPLGYGVISTSATAGSHAGQKLSRAQRTAGSGVEWGSGEAGALMHALDQLHE